MTFVRCEAPDYGTVFFFMLTVLNSFSKFRKHFISVIPHVCTHKNAGTHTLTLSEPTKSFLDVVRPDTSD